MLGPPIVGGGPQSNEQPLTRKPLDVRQHQLQDFYGIKKSLRVPPVSDIRKDCRRIIAGLDGEKVKVMKNGRM